MADGRTSSQADADIDMRIERALRAAIQLTLGDGAPPHLRRGIEYAVFPGGSRIRPSLCISVATALGDRRPDITDAAAVAIEFVHCASLVHDDLPCFDNAELRRGKMTLHRAFDEATAVLTGDALLVMAFQTLAGVGDGTEIALLAHGTGASAGIIAGQAWESRRECSLEDYHRAKTASLFAAAASIGASAAGAPLSGWRRFGEIIGRAYQAADDLADSIESDVFTGKSRGRDALLGRPNLVKAEGAEATFHHMLDLLGEARACIPKCLDDEPLQRWLNALSSRLQMHGTLVAKAGMAQGRAQACPAPRANVTDSE